MSGSNVDGSKAGIPYPKSRLAGLQAITHISGEQTLHWATLCLL